ncbi:MAG: hypothetical protein AAF922_07575 [Pseudomonadota bacterium]
MRKTIRRVFLVIGVIGLFVWHYVYTGFLSRDCAAAGTAPEDCAYILPWDLSLQQAAIMVIVPGFVATIPFFLAFLVGGEPLHRPDPAPQSQEKDDP